MGGDITDSDNMMMTDSISAPKFTDQPDIPDKDRYSHSSVFNKVYYERSCEATDVLNLARTLFDMKEYRKCAHILKKIANPKC